MSKHQTSLLFDGSHFRVNLPISIIRERGWEKGDALWIDEKKGHVIIGKTKSKKSKLTVHSIGYEGKSIDEFIVFLKQNDVRQLIDVRETPFSFKKSFSKTPLKIALNSSNIIYHHIKELGTDKTSRNEYKKTGNIDKLCKTFEQNLKNNPDKYELLKALITYQSSAIMCLEDDFRMCHRQIIEKELENDGFKVVHICNGKQKRFL